MLIGAVSSQGPPVWSLVTQVMAEFEKHPKLTRFSGTGQGAITAVAWQGSYVAWVNELGVKIMDIESQERITFVERPGTMVSPAVDTCCQLFWYVSRDR